MAIYGEILVSLDTSTGLAKRCLTWLDLRLEREREEIPLDAA